MRVRYLNCGCVKRGVIYLIGLSEMEPELIIQKDRLLFFHDKQDLYLSCGWFIEGIYFFFFFPTLKKKKKKNPVRMMRTPRKHKEEP
jgi:hypothetical protein